jgi:hypothetical protein
MGRLTVETMAVNLAVTRAGGITKQSKNI